MRTMINKVNKIIFAICVVCGFVGCADFFDQESDQVIFSDQDHLNSATDTIYSVTGILNKLQALADRTILLGEVRGDLVDVTDVTSNDLRQVAQFNISDENMYNQPSDYYAVINNCNYFIANVDTALRDNRNNYVFMKEYAAVKAIRAWTYLQLVLNYGSVPFVTEPILTKDQAEADYPRYDIQAVCEYFISDLLPLTDKYSRDYPGYRTIRNTDSRFFWFPLYIVLGDLHLWAGSVSGSTNHYREAALSYYKYIDDRNGMNSSYPTSATLITYSPGYTTWNRLSSWGSFGYSDESYRSDTELITMIPGDSIRAEGNYSELRNLFNSNEDNMYKVSLTPSAGLIQLSESQAHCCVSSNGLNVLYAPQGLPEHRSGDLRLWNVYTEGHTFDRNTGDQIETQRIDKYTSRNVHIYRRQMVYLRMAEALNLAGFPRMAFQVLSQGLNEEVIDEEVYPYCSQGDSLFVSQFEFPKSRYGLFTVEHLIGIGGGVSNTVGMHSRGSGWTPMNEYYRLPVDEEKTEEEQKADLQAYVDSLILNEGALEFAFEGTRFYDLMRFALRSDNPGQFMADKVYGRRGKDKKDAMRAEIKNDVSNPRNWYLQWNGKIGFE